MKISVRFASCNKLQMARNVTRMPWQDGAVNSAFSYQDWHTTCLFRDTFRKCTVAATTLELEFGPTEKVVSLVSDRYKTITCTLLFLVETILSIKLPFKQKRCNSESQLEGSKQEYPWIATKLNNSEITGGSWPLLQRKTWCPSTVCGISWCSSTSQLLLYDS